jgi:DNA mismatch repair protein MutL
MTTMIKRLDDDTINKIAAGEVVERPASIVKELVENAIDAGASMIEVSLFQGGLERILVSDNGSGIDPEDLPLAVERHATSKIGQAKDLFLIQTMGFRGEALASIAAVCEFSLSSRVAQATQGQTLSNSSGSWLQNPYHGPKGTRILVEKLFAGIPARRNFLRSDASEYSHCLDLMQAIALANPSLGFDLSHNQRNIFTLAPADPGTNKSEIAIFRQRLAELFGEELASTLQEVSAENEFGSMKGLISPPGQDKATSKWIYTFVNGRLVRDKQLNFAILRGYHSHLMKGRFPVAAIQLQVDPSLIDVNVHPAKTEIRLQYQAETQNLLAQAVRATLRAGHWSSSPLEPEPSVQRETESHRPSLDPRNAAQRTQNATRPLPKQISLRSSSEQEPMSYSLNQQRKEREIFSDATSPFEASPPLESSPQAPSTSQDQAASPAGELPPRFDWAQLKFLGTFSQCYLLFEEKDLLLVIDQHAFHERILFERLSRDQSLLSESAALMIPDVVNLNPREMEILQHLQRQLSEMGFLLKFPDAQNVEIFALPKLIIHRQPDEILGGLIEAYDEDRGQADAHVWLGQIIATIACHGAVRAGEELSEHDRATLLAQAKDVDFFLNCPHGRPVFKWFHKSEVGAWFER